MPAPLPAPVRLAGLALLVAAGAPAAHAQLGGSYEIEPSGTGDFTSFTEAVAALVAEGVDDAVTFDVRPGTYVEQVTIPAIAGADEDNTVTFRGVGPRPVLRHTAGASSNWIVRLDGAQYVALRTLAFEPQGTTYVRSVVLENGASDVEIDDCLFTAAPSLSGDIPSIAQVFSEADGGTPSDRVTVRNNTFSAYTAVRFAGTPADPAEEVRILGNTVFGQPGVSFYVQDVDRLDVRDNVALGSGVGLLAIDVARATVTGNTLDAESAALRLRDVVGTTGAPALVANNFLRSSASSHVVTAVHRTDLRFVHNTVYASGTGAAVDLSADVSGVVQNNILYAEGGGIALLVDDGAALESDHNLLYTSGGPLTSVDGTSYSSLAAHQDATDWDRLSESEAVAFVNPGAFVADLHLAGASVSDADLLGLPLADVTADRDGDPRGTLNTTMGADQGQVFDGLDGLYQVGAGPTADYATVTDAIDDLNGRGTTGTVTFRLFDGYSADDHAVLREVRSTSTSALVYIRPEGLSSMATLSHAATSAGSNFVLQIDGADRVLLSNLVFDTSGAAAPYGRALVLRGDVDDFFLSNSALVGLGGAGNDPQGALLYDESSGTTRRVTDTSFSGGSVGLYVAGDADDPVVGLRVRGSAFTDQTAGGLHLTHAAQPAVVECAVTSSAANATAIRVVGGGGATIEQNEIALLGTGLSNVGIALATLGDGAVTRVVNNGVSVQTTGLTLTNVDQARVYHNTVRTRGASFGAAYLASGTSAGHVLLNNLFVASGGARALSAVAGAVAQSDRNDLVTTGAVLTRVGTADHADLAAHQAGTGLDANSVSLAVTFADAAAGDLRLASNLGDARLAGTPLADVPRDLDGDARSATAPYMGADEADVPIVLTVRFALNALLQGAYPNPPTAPSTLADVMRTDLSAAGLIPLTQPYADPAYDGTPLDYDGTESVPAGFFDAHPEFVDWVLVGLRSDPGGPDLARRALLLREGGDVRDGATGTVLAFEVPPGSYHIVVSHRNHLPIMTTAVELSATFSGQSVTTPSRVVGGAAAGVFVEGSFLGLAAGDGTADGAVLADDRQTVWLPQVGQAGYLPGDVNLDGSVLADDLNTYLLPNIGRQTLVPGAGGRSSGPGAPQSAR